MDGYLPGMHHFIPRGDSCRPCEDLLGCYHRTEVNGVSSLTHTVAADTLASGRSWILWSPVTSHGGRSSSKNWSPVISHGGRTANHSQLSYRARSITAIGCLDEWGATSSSSNAVHVVSTTRIRMEHISSWGSQYASSNVALHVGLNGAPPDGGPRVIPPFIPSGKEHAS